MMQDAIDKEVYCNRRSLGLYDIMQLTLSYMPVLVE